MTLQKTGNIILIEDELSLQNLIRLNLEAEGYSVSVFSEGNQAIKNIHEIISKDLVILDVMLPQISGLQICEKIREISSVPILFLSAKGTTSDRIEGLKKGGTDYLVKPFDLEELLLKINILLSAQKAKDIVNRYVIDEKVIDFDTYEVLNKEEKTLTTLSKKEIELLQLFINNNGKVISRNEILDKIWGINQYPTSRTIDNFVLTFRKLFEKDSKSPIFFHSVRGVGYKFTNA